MRWKSMWKRFAFSLYSARKHSPYDLPRIAEQKPQQQEPYYDLNTRLRITSPQNKFSGVPQAPCKMKSKIRGVIKKIW